MIDSFMIIMFAILSAATTVWLWFEYRRAMRGWIQASEQRDQAMELLELEQRLRDSENDDVLLPRLVVK